MHTRQMQHSHIFGPFQEKKGMFNNIDKKKQVKKRPGQLFSQEVGEATLDVTVATMQMRRSCLEPLQTSTRTCCHMQSLHNVHHTDTMDLP